MGACCSSSSNNTVIEGRNGENTNSNQRRNNNSQPRRQVALALGRTRSNNGQNNEQQITTTPSPLVPLDNNNTNINNNPRQLYTEIEELQRDLSLMEAFFQSVLGQAYQMGMDVDPSAAVAGQQGTAPPNNAPPPASQKALRQIPTVALCAEDLSDENNRECCICFEENVIGVKVARLPCGHVYHRPCIEGWLCKHCTCPVCRYELETDDPSYERGRLERMRHRKPRFRKHELNNMKIFQLRELLTFLKLNDAGNTFTEKRDIVDKIINSGRVEVIASPEPLEFKISELRALGVGKLKKAMNDAGVFFDPVDIVEKEDMVQLFINSGRVILLADDPDPEESMVNDYNNTANNSDTMVIDDANDSKVAAAVAASSSSMIDDNDDNYYDDYNEMSDGQINNTSKKFKSDNTTNEDSKVDVYSDVFTSTAAAASASINTRNGFSSSASSTDVAVDHSSSKLKSYLRSKTISQLKAIGRELGVSLLDCVEKAEMVDKLSPFFNV